MPGLQYTWPDDDYIPALTRTSPSGLTFSGTADASYPVENLGDQDPQNPFKTADTTVAIVGDLGAALPIGLLVLVHHNFVAGLSPDALVLDLDDNSSFTSPETFPITVPDYQEDDFPGNILLDLVAEGYGVKTYRYFRVRNVSANAVAVSIGELILCPGWRELPVDFRVNAEDDESHPLIRNVSEGGGVPTKYTHEYRPRWLRGEILDTTQDDDELIRRWNRAARGEMWPFLVHPHLPIDEPWYVSFDGLRLPRKRLFRTEQGLVVNGWSLAFEEQARGLIPEPSGAV